MRVLLFVFIVFTITPINGGAEVNFIPPVCDLPVASCSDLKLELSSSGFVQIFPHQIDSGSVASCGMDSIFLTIDLFDCSNIPSSFAHLVVVDSLGQLDSCSFTITIEDNTAPIISPISDITLFLSPMNCTTSFEVDFVHFDNCSSQSIVETGPQIGDPLTEGTYECQWAAFDDSGNISRDTFTIEVLPNPNQTNSLVCDEDIQINLDETGTYVLIPEYVLIGSNYGCPDNYLIQIDGEDNMVDCGDIGEVTATLEDLETGNFCTISISINDNYIPELTFMPLDTFNCFEGLPDSENPDLQPLFEDNCGLEQIQMISQTTADDNICDGFRVFKRSWLAIDMNGNSSELVDQFLYVRRIALEFPSNFTGFCTEYNYDDLGPDVCGMPNIFGNTDCGYGSSFSDIPVSTCGDLSSILRTWAVIDWCTNSVITTDINGTSNIQLITIEDSSPPVIGNASIFISPEYDCFGLGSVILDPIFDDCQTFEVGLFIEGYGELQYTLDSLGEVNGGVITEPGLNIGQHELLITATDACGNYSEKSVLFEILDNLSPVALCEDEVKVSLNSSGNADIPAHLLDDGSFDNCCLQDLLVKRQDQSQVYTSNLLFDCSDITISPIEVELYVEDCNGNSNTCELVVSISDEQAPSVEGPEDLSIYCDLFYSDYQSLLDSAASSSSLNQAALSLLNNSFGDAVFMDNCSLELGHEFSYSIDDCGNGEIRRFWTAKDPGDSIATEFTQLIGIQHSADWIVQFPEDWSGIAAFGCTGLQTFGEPQFEGVDCEQLSVSFEDVLFTDEPNSCYQILRTWTVINNCSFDSDSSQDNGLDLGDRRFNVSGVNYKTYLQSIQIMDTELVDEMFLEDTSFVLMGVDCDATLVMPFPEFVDCELLSVTIESEDLSIYPSIGEQLYFDVPPGVYSAKYLFEDLCGNEKEEEITITMIDGLAPALLCPEEYIMNYNPFGSTLSVDELSITAEDNCSLVELQLIDSNGQLVDEIDLGCDQLGHQWIAISAKDQNDNQSECSIKLLLKDDNEFCTDYTVLNGTVQTLDGQAMDNVEIYIEGYGNTISYSDGAFMFSTLNSSDQVLVEPHYEEANPLNGVTTLDVVAITKHILNIEPFDEDFMFIAADANFSNSVSTLDVVKIQRLILGIDSEFVGGESWRFVDADYVFNPLDIWDFQEYIIIDSFDGSIQAGFTGIKIGDVNASAVIN